MVTASDHKSALATLLRQHQERGEPFAFAGREDVIERIIATAQQNYKKPIPGATFLISGAPGAGKTSLIRQLLRQWDAHEGIPTTSIFCENVPDERDDVADVWERLTAKLTGRPREELFQTREKSKSGSTGFSYFIRAMGTVTHKATSEAASVWSTRMLSNHRKKDTYASSCILAVDEIQNIRVNTEMSSMVKNLHTQSEAPILLVCSGLADSRTQLDRAKAISADRMNTKNNVISLGALTQDEAHEAVVGGLKRIAEVAGVNEIQLCDMFDDELTERSDQWPRHITCYLHGVAEALIEQDTPDLNALDKSRALDLGDQERKDYYQSRVNSCRLPERIIGRLYNAMNEGTMSANAAKGFLRQMIREDESPEGEVLREEFIGTDQCPFNQALHAGVITLDTQNQCEIPIPSMETYIKDRCDAHVIGVEGITR